MKESLKLWETLNAQNSPLGDGIGRLAEAEILRAQGIQNAKIHLAMKEWLREQIQQQEAVCKT